ncbi:unnamed protein product [Lota lota]
MVQRASGDVALTYLESKALRLEGEACLEFWYQTVPTASESSELRVLLKENTQGLVQIWTSPAQHHGGAWRHVSLPLAVTEASKQVVFEAAQGSSLEGHVSFDHIGIRNGQCARQCEPNTELWTDESTRCVCSGAEQLSCSAPLCPGGPASDGPGARSAGGLTARGICTVHTDPQCSTFDGALFRFMAPCTYTLARNCDPGPSTSGLPAFSVEVVNARSGSNATEAAVQRVNVDVNNVRLSLLKSETQRVMVNGVWRSLPLTLPGATVNIRSNPAVVTVETDDKVLISYDNAGAVHVKLPAPYAGKVCGMCGNFNSLLEDDNQRPDGSAALDATELARSWQTGPRAAPCDTILVPHMCAPLEEQSYGGGEFCGELLSSVGPFSRCLAVLGVESYYRSCVAGMCASHGELAAMCRTMQSYAKICSDAGVAVPAWRNATACTLECGANSHYDACAAGCPDACSSMDLSGACGSCEERCVCDPGYMHSGEACVPAEDCGCWNNGRHHEKGTVFLDEGCTQRCQCLGSGQTQCSAWRCPDTEICKDVDGVKGCFPPETVTCSVYGDPHYITYDDKAYNFQGGCNYTLATTCGEQPPVQFTVTGRNTNPTDQNLTRSKLEAVVLQIQELHLTLTQNGKVYVHNNLVHLPYSSNGSFGWLKVHRQRQLVVVETGVGLRVMIDGQNRLFLQVDERYKGQLCGMCGTYSGLQGDDFVRPDGSNAIGPFDFGNSWRVMEDSSPCIAYPDDPKVCVEHGDDQAVSDCSAILGDSFSLCHKEVHPLTYVSSCVYDHCATNGDLHTLCDSLESYSTACQVAGVELPAWKNDTACVCALNCNFDSHMCGWQQLIQDSFNWTRHSGPTPSTSTGPNEDHTTGDGHYLYIEANSATYGDTARLLSPECSHTGPQCLRFWYHMYGSADTMGLHVYLLQDRLADAVWWKRNDQGDVWHEAMVDLTPTGPFQFNDEWYTAHCSQKCECDQDDGIGKIECDDEDECDGVCLQNAAGQYSCLSTDFSECTIKGDPEYRTFDDLKHTFRGDHSYVLAQTTSQSRTIPGFYIEGINTRDEDYTDHGEEDHGTSSEEHRHRDRDEDSDEDAEDDSRENNPRHSLRALKITVYNHTVEFKRNRMLVVDGRVSRPPVSPSRGLTIRQHSSGLYLKTDFGLTVKFDGHSRAEILLPHIYRRKVGGLCGNFDGRKNNDLMKPDGGQARSEHEFGHSWRVNGEPLRITGNEYRPSGIISLERMEHGGPTTQAYCCRRTRVDPGT